MNQAVRTLTPTEVYEKRAKVVANSPLKKLRNDLQREGRLGAGMVLPPRSKKSRPNRDHVAEICAYADRMKREADVGPTPERLAKGDTRRVEPEKDERKSIVKYGPKKDLIDEYKGEWRPEGEAALRRLKEDSTGADVTGVTLNYNSAGGGSYGSRAGGMINAHWTKIEKYERFCYAMDRLPARGRRIMEWLIIPREASEQTMRDLEDVGRWLFPHFKNPHGLRMLGLGYVIAVADKLVDLYVHWDMERQVERRIKNERTISNG